jgi:hypothetical protein
MKRLFVCLLILTACHPAHVRSKIPGPTSAADHSHRELINVHATLLLCETRLNDPRAPKNFPLLFNQTALAFNTASGTWNDYLLVLRIHGDAVRVLKRFNSQLHDAVNLGADLKGMYEQLPPPEVKAPAAVEEKKP